MVTVESNIETAYAVDARTRVAVSGLAVYERAVTLRDPRGKLCPNAGWAITRPLTSGHPSVNQGTSLRPGSASTFSDMSVRNFKPRFGSRASSGTG